jgi:hypothetical protein
MYKACMAWSNQGNPESAGEFHPTGEWLNTLNKEIVETKASNIVGHMFLCEEHLTYPIISHECLHAAMAHERFLERFKMEYGGGVNQHEERLAYYHTYCVEEVVKQLLKHKFKIKPTGM